MRTALEFITKLAAIIWESAGLVGALMVLVGLIWIFLAVMFGTVHITVDPCCQLFVRFPDST